MKLAYIGGQKLTKRFSWVAKWKREREEAVTAAEATASEGVGAEAEDAKVEDIEQGEVQRGDGRLGQCKSYAASCYHGK